jgi:hypothetical protein
VAPSPTSLIRWYFQGTMPTFYQPVPVCGFTWLKVPLIVYAKMLNPQTFVLCVDCRRKLFLIIEPWPSYKPRIFDLQSTWVLYRQQVCTPDIITT